MKTITEYLVNNHIQNDNLVQTIKINMKMSEWISEYIENWWTEYDVAKFLTSKDKNNVDMNLFFEESHEYLHLHKAFNKNSNTTYALSIICDMDNEFPSEKQWDVDSGDCLTLWNMNNTKYDEDIFAIFIDNLNKNLDTLIR